MIYSDVMVWARFPSGTWRRHNLVHALALFAWRGVEDDTIWLEVTDA